MADYDDVKISGLIINNLTQAKYNELLAAGKIDPNQIYCTEQGDYTTNEDFNSALGTINESIEGLQTNKADKSDTYTKAEVDAKVSSVYRFMGSVLTVDALPTDATVGDTYNIEADGSNYAWDGENWDKLSETVDLTPYLTKEEAGSTYETIENANLHKNNTSNPHQITKAQVGLGNVDNTSDLEKPNLQQAALDLKQNVLVQGENITITGDTISAKDTTYTAGDGIDITNGVISNTRISAEWGNITGTLSSQTDLNTALGNKADKSTTYTKEEVNSAINEVGTKANKNAEDIESLKNNKANASDLTSHINNNTNPHGVTKTQIGLGNVDNTSDKDKPISDATQEALNEINGNIGAIVEVFDAQQQKIDSIDHTLGDTSNKINTHTDNKSNPHNVTAAQVGLGNVNNTSDANKPVSTAQQAALDLKANKTDTYTKAEVDAKVSSVYRFMGSVANQAALPTTGQVIGDTYNAEDTGANYAWNGTSWDKLSETIDLTPYLTKGEASTTYATIAAVTGLENQIEGKLVIIDGQIEELTDTYNAANEHISNTNNPHGVTKAQVGLGNVDNTSDLAKPISTATQNALNLKADKSTTYTKTEVDNLLDDKLDISTAESTYATKEDIASAGSLPTQNGNAGKYLTTNGTTASWANFPPVATLKQW